MTKVYSRPIPSSLMDADKLKCYISIRDFIESKNWGLMSDRYFNIAQGLSLLCPQNHYVNYYFCNFKRKNDYSVCYQCPGSNEDIPLKSMMTKNQSRMYDEMYELALLHSWTMLSDKFTHVQKPVSMLCPHLHTVEMYYTTFKYKEDYSVCRICVANTKIIIPLEERKLGSMNSKQLACYIQLFNIAIINGWYLISDRYEERDASLFFLCPNEHTVSMNTRNFREKKDYTCCKICTGRSDEYLAQNYYSNVIRLGGTPIGEYTLPDKPTECFCKNGHKCYPKPETLQQGHDMCLECINRSPEIAAQEYYKNVAAQGGICLEPYVNARTHSLVLCPKMHLCTPSPSNINNLGGNICFKCPYTSTYAAKLRYEEEMERREYKMIEPYTTGTTETKFECNVGHPGTLLPKLVISGGAYCKICWPTSRGETKTALALELLGIDYIREFKFCGTSWKYDFIIPGISIEDDGLQHFEVCKFTPTVEDLLKSQTTDIQKMLFVRSRGLRQIRFDQSWYGKSVEEFAEAIVHAINQFRKGGVLWVSTPSMYTWLDSRFNDILTIPKEMLNTPTILTELRILTQIPILSPDSSLTERKENNKDEVKTEHSIAPSQNLLIVSHSIHQTNYLSLLNQLPTDESE